MAQPIQVDELDPVTSLTAAAAVAVVQDNDTLRTTPRAFVSDAASYTPAGTGGVAEPVETALRRFVHTGQYGSQANYESARDALTGTVGVPSLQVTGSLSASGVAGFQVVQIGGTLSVSAGAVFKSDLRVDGTLSVSAGAAFTGNLQVGGNLSVSGAIAFEVLQVNSTLSVSAGAAFQNVQVGGAMSVSGAASFATISASAVAGLVVATQAQMEAGTSTTNIVTPARQHLHPSSPKGGVYFRQAAGAVSVQASFNVTGVARNATGRYTVTWNMDFSSTDYAWFLTQDADRCVIETNSISQEAGSVAFTVERTVDLVDQDPSDCYVLAFGDQ